MKNFLRWIAVPFAAIIGSLAAYFLVSIWTGFNNVGYEVYNGEHVASITKLILGVVAQCAAGAALVFCGTYIAPTHKKSCSVVLATIACVISLVSVVLHKFMYEFSILLLIHCIATAGGAIYVSCNFEDIFKADDAQCHY